MGNVTVRRIDDTAQHNARLAAAANRRSLEAELRDLIERTYAPAGIDRAARLRALSASEKIAHLCKVAGGADIDRFIPARESEDIEFPEL
ncbi:FitA-like ribbon-helix-helix domain-containing protein [Sphingomonas bacterium]|uniref:FitA-like ribbon-helix-helix domain-containing protein n=1 Tax=Sphingomonas bacterium TaxID=1895847 RepID=UPI003F68A81C